MTEQGVGNTGMAAKPLAGLKVVEMAGVGPTPFCGMLLADMGAEIVTIAAPAGRTSQMPVSQERDPVFRGRSWLTCDLKNPEERQRVEAAIDQADVLIEGFRPGVMERLGLGPDACLGRNPKLVYGRMTGWGQDGPFAMAAGHDPNYLALTGALFAIGAADAPPSLPLNLVADMGGGALYLAVGLLAAVLHARSTGCGQVVDAAMLDGAASLMTSIYGMKAAGMWSDRRGSNLLDGGCPYVACYVTADGGYLSLAAVEGPFYANLLKGLGLDPAAIPPRDDISKWPELRSIFANRILSKPRDDWAEIFRNVDACVTPVLNMSEAPLQEHNIARGVFVEYQGAKVPGAAPRFSVSETGIAAARGRPAEDLLAGWQTDETEG